MHVALANINLGKLTPSRGEVLWLYRFLRKRTLKAVLEFGCGVTSIAALNALSRHKHPPRYTVVETYQPNIDMLRAVYSNVEVITAWGDIPKDAGYDLVLVDGSSGSLTGRGICRVEATQCAEPLSTADAVFIAHDAHSFSGKGVVQYLAKSKYTLLSWFEGKKGFAAYQKPKAVEEKWLEYNLLFSVAPKICKPCRLCGSRASLISEIPVKGDIMNDKGFVMRIGCDGETCPGGDYRLHEKDDSRTEFLPYSEAIKAWNKMSEVKA